MNKRIQKLAEQAGLDLIHGNFMTASQEKFAELIVKECMACSTWVGKMNTNTNSCESIHTAHAINQRIKQLFGVEE